MCGIGSLNDFIQRTEFENLLDWSKNLNKKRSFGNIYVSFIRYLKLQQYNCLNQGQKSFLLPIYPTTHLFFSNPHVVLDPREHRGLDEESVTPRGLPSTLHPGALFLARVNQLQNLAVLLLVHLLKVRNYGYTCTAIRQLNRFLHWIVVSRIQDNLLLLFVSFFYVLKTSSWYRWCARR